RLDVMLFPASAATSPIHSFPTRRSSDLGVNNRNLRTLTVDVHASEELIGRMPRDVIAVSESGLSKAEDLDRPLSLTAMTTRGMRSEEHTSELQSQSNLVCRLLLEKKKKE